jgi:MFS family permease
MSSRPIDYSGRPIGPLRLARAMAVNIAAGCCIMAALAVLWPTAAITAVFLREQLGASKTLIGLNLALCTFGTAIALPGAWLFNRLQRRKATWMAITTVSRTLLFAPAIVALLAAHTEWHLVLIWVVILSMFLMNTGGVFTSPGWWSWMADLIPESMLGSFFGRRWRWLLLAQSLASLVAGVALDMAAPGHGLRLTFFAIFVVSGLLVVIDPLLFSFVPEPVRPRPPRRTLGEVAREYLEPFRDRAFRTVLLGAGAYGFFYFLPNLFFPLFLRGEQAGDYWIGGRAPVWVVVLVTVVFAVAQGVAANAWGQLADRIGHRIVWILGSLAYCTYIAYFFINQGNYAVLAIVHSVVFGLLYAGQPVAVQNMALSMAPPHRREFYMSVFLAVTQIANGLGPVFGGWLADRYRVFPSLVLPSGQPACYIHLLLAIAFVGMLLALPVMVRVPDPHGDTVLPWFGRLVSGDLYRMVTSMTALASASSVSRRARALRRISHGDGNVLLPEIAAALDDPDLRIRREALLALGRIGTPEALDLLRWYLHEPDAVLRAQSVEAIGQAEVPDRGSLLKRALRDPDSRVRRAAVDALGRAGGRDALSELRGLLTDERDGEVLVSAAVALSKMKEFSAVREMLDLALRSANTTVRAQMLVALADLLSGTSDFHKLWREDRRWRGIGFARLARRLRRQARVLTPMIEPQTDLPRSERRQLVTAVDNEVDLLLENVQTERWRNALASLRQLAHQFLRLRYRYQGGDENALEFVSAVSPDQAQRYWLITYLHHACDGVTAAEAPWDGLTLLALHVMVYGQPSA